LKNTPIEKDKSAVPQQNGKLLHGKDFSLVWFIENLAGFKSSHAHGPPPVIMGCMIVL
jgi:hypothetical protein